MIWKRTKRRATTSGQDKPTENIVLKGIRLYALKSYLLLIRVFVQGAPVPTSTQQTAIPDPQPHRGPPRADHLLCGGEQVSQGGSLSF